MKKNTFAVTILLALVGVGCGTSGVDRRAIDSLKKDTADLRIIQAQHTEAITQIRSELQSMQGKLEEIQFKAYGKTAELERTLQKIGTRVPPPEGIPEDILNEDEDRIGRLGGGAAAEQFSDGLRRVRIGDFRGAIETFKKFSEDNPGTAFTDNALFWVGMCHDKLGEYDQSITAYSEVFRQYPAEDRVPISLFNLAEAFVKIGSTEDAAVTFQKLVDDHPRSSVSSKAKQRIKELGRKRR